MKRIQLGLALVATAFIAGCSTYSSNMRVGNDMSYVSLSDQREAARSIKVYDTLPDGAELLGEIDAGRCHRSFVETSPEESVVMLDLKVAAFAMGADGIYDVQIAKESALTKNCWYMLDASAKAISLP